MEAMNSAGDFYAELLLPHLEKFHFLDLICTYMHSHPLPLSRLMLKPAVSSLFRVTPVSVEGRLYTWAQDI